MEIKDNYEFSKKATIFYQPDSKLRSKCLVKLNRLSAKLMEEKHLEFASNVKGYIKDDEIENEQIQLLDTVKDGLTVTSIMDKVVESVNCYDNVEQKNLQGTCKENINSSNSESFHFINKDLSLNAIKTRSTDILDKEVFELAANIPNVSVTTDKMLTYNCEHLINSSNLIFKEYENHECKSIQSSSGSCEIENDLSISLSNSKDLKLLKVKYLLKRLQFSGAGPKTVNISNIELETESLKKNRSKRKCTSLVKYESVTEDITGEYELQKNKLCPIQNKNTSLDQMSEGESSQHKARCGNFRKKYYALKRHLNNVTGRKNSSGFVIFCFFKMEKKFDRSNQDIKFTENFKNMISEWILLSEKKKRFYDRMSKQFIMQKTIGGRKFMEKMSLLVSTHFKSMPISQKWIKKELIRAHANEICKNCKRPLEPGCQIVCIQCREPIYSSDAVEVPLSLIGSDVQNNISQGYEHTHQAKSDDYSGTETKVFQERTTIEANDQKLKCNISEDKLQSKNGYLNTEIQTQKFENFKQESLESVKKISNGNLVRKEAIKNNCSSNIRLSLAENLKRKFESFKGRSSIKKKKLRKHSLKCSMCSFSTLYRSEFYSHLSIHGQIYSCDYCSYKSIQKNNWKIHLLSKHTAEKPFQCKVCSYSTADISHLTRHIRSHSGRPIFCVSCDYRCNQLTSLKKHSEKHNGILMECPFCQYETINSSDLMNHYSDSERGKWYLLTLKCSKCNFWCYENAVLTNHINECKSQVKVAGIRISELNKQISSDLKLAPDHRYINKNNYRESYGLRNRKKPRLKCSKIDNNSSPPIAGVANALINENNFIDTRADEVSIKGEIKQEYFEKMLYNLNDKEQVDAIFLQQKELKEEVCEEDAEEEFPSFDIGIKALTVEDSTHEAEDEISLQGGDDSSSSWTEDHIDMDPIDNLSDHANCGTDDTILKSSDDAADITRYKEFEKIVLDKFENNEVWRTIYVTRKINELGYEYYLCLCEIEDLVEVRNKMIKVFLEELSFLYLDFANLTNKSQKKFSSIILDNIKDIENAFSEQMSPNILLSTSVSEISNCLNIVKVSLQCFIDLIKKGSCDQHCRNIRKGKNFIDYLTVKFSSRELQLKDENRFLKAKLYLVKNYITSSQYTMTVDLYHSIVSSTFCRLVIFNHCDSSALSQVTLKQWDDAKQLSTLSPTLVQMLICLDDSEMEMYNFFNVAMKIDEILILIPQPCVAALNLLSDPSLRQSVNISLNNPYLFTTESDAPICGNQCIDHFFENNFAKEFHPNFVTYYERLSVGALDIPKMKWKLISENIPKILHNPLINCLPPKLNFIIRSCYSPLKLLLMDPEWSTYLGIEISSSIHRKAKDHDSSIMTDCVCMSFGENDTSLMTATNFIHESEIVVEFEKFENTLLNEFENSEVKRAIFVTQEILELGFEFYRSLGKYNVILKKKNLKVKNFMTQIANLYINYLNCFETLLDMKIKFNVFAANHIIDLKNALLSQLSSEIFYLTDECRYKVETFDSSKKTMLQYLDNFGQLTCEDDKHFLFRKGDQFQKYLSIKFCHRNFSHNFLHSRLLAEAKLRYCRSYLNNSRLHLKSKKLCKHIFSQTFYRVLIFNKCDPSSLSQITLQHWETAKMKAAVSSLFLNLLTPEEQKFYKFFHVTIDIGEKLILIPFSCVNALNKLCDPKLRLRMDIMSRNCFLFPAKCIRKFSEMNYFNGFHSSFLTCLERWQFGLLNVPDYIRKLILNIVKQKDKNSEIIDCLPNNLKFAVLSCHSSPDLLSDIIERNSSHLPSMEKGLTDFDVSHCHNDNSNIESLPEALPDIIAQNKTNEYVKNIFNSNNNPLFQKFLSFEAETIPSGDVKVVDIVLGTRRLREIGFEYYLTNNTSYGSVRCYMQKLASLYLKFLDIYEGADPEFDDMFDIKNIKKLKDSIFYNLAEETFSTISVSEHIGMLRSTGFYLAHLLEPFVDTFKEVKFNINLFNEKFDDHFQQVEISKQAIHLAHSPSSFFYDQVNICEVKKLLEVNYDCLSDEKILNISEYKKYEEMTFCRLVLFNECDPSLLSGLTIKQWKTATNKSKVSLQQLAMLSRSELNMLHYFNTTLCMLNRVTGNFKLILIPDPCVKVMNVLANAKIRLSAQIATNNYFMFPSLDNSFVNDGPLDGQKYMNKFCQDNFGIEFKNCKFNDNDRMLVGLFNIPETNYNFILKTVSTLKGHFLPMSIQNILIHNNKNETGHLDNHDLGEYESSRQKVNEFQFNIKKSSDSELSNSISKEDEARKVALVRKDFFEFELNILKKISDPNIIQLSNEYKHIQEIGYQHYLCSYDIGDKNIEYHCKAFLEHLVTLFMKFRKFRKNIIFEDMFNINYLRYVKNAVLETSSFLGNMKETLITKKHLLLHEVLKFSGLQLAIILSKEKPQQYVTFKVYEFNECFYLHFQSPDKTLPTIVECSSYAEQSKSTETIHNDSDKLDKKYQVSLKNHEKKLVTTSFWRYLLCLDKEYPTDIYIRRFLTKNPDFLEKFKSKKDEQRKFIIEKFLTDTRLLLSYVAEGNFHKKKPQSSIE